MSPVDRLRRRFVARWRAFQKDHGIRIDHLLLSPQAADRLSAVEIFRKARSLDKPSDHVPVIGVFDA